MASISLNVAVVCSSPTSEIVFTEVLRDVGEVWTSLPSYARCTSELRPGAMYEHDLPRSTGEVGRPAARKGAVA